MQGVFTVRTVRMCNSLLQLVVSAGSIESFKRLLDKHLKEHNIQRKGKLLSPLTHIHLHRLNLMDYCPYSTLPTM